MTLIPFESEQVLVVDMNFESRYFEFFESRSDVPPIALVRLRSERNAWTFENEKIHGFVSPMFHLIQEIRG